MERGQAIAIAKHAARCYPEPYTHELGFMPHEWVIQAVMNTPTRWRDAKTELPTCSDQSMHFSIPVLAVIDDPRYRINGDDPFVDVVGYWPALKKWTVTHQVRSDLEAADYPCNVTYWQPFDEMPLFKKVKT